MATALHDRLEAAGSFESSGVAADGEVKPAKAALQAVGWCKPEKFPPGICGRTSGGEFSDYAGISRE